MTYANPEALVSTEWLAAHLDDPSVRIIDGTFVMPQSGRNARAEYDGAHIPGAVYLDINEVADTASSLPHMLPDPAGFAAAVGALGIGNRHRVVVYDTHGLMSAARVWWMFRVFGHDTVAVLNGGLPKWRTEGRPVTDALVAPVPETFHAGFRPELVWSMAQIQRNITEAGTQQVDARSRDRFEGRVDEAWPGRRRGHVPGSLNVPFNDLIDPATQTVLPAEQVAARFRDAGVDLARPVVASCGSGVTACVLAFGLYLIGKADAAVYDGSWAEWGLPGDLPVAVGPYGAS